jgi:undecaprenyl-diphosphatase
MAPTWFDLFKALGLGLLDGLTEFVPLSASGHLLLAQRFLGLGGGNFGPDFVLVIRVAAWLALLSVYLVRLLRLVGGMFSDPMARRFVYGLAAAFLPALLVGALAHERITNALSNLWIVCFALIGGTVLLWVDHLKPEPRWREATRLPLSMYLLIGVAQCLAFIPGLSRSGASIVAALLLGADRRAAAEFSLWLAMPTMAGAIAYDLYRTHGPMGGGNAVILGIGFAASFAAALMVVRTLLDYVATHGLRLFAWWRVIVGSLGLIALAMGG